MPNWFIIANPAAGGGLVQKNWPDIEAELQKLNIQYVSNFTIGPGHAITMVQEQTKPGAKRPGKLASLEKMLAALISTQPPSSAVAAQVPGDTTDKKPPRPARKVAKRDTVH